VGVCFYCNKLSHFVYCRPLVILMDSTDQLSSKFSAHEMSWVPRFFTKNCYTVLSMLSDRYTCLKNMKTRTSDACNYIKLVPFADDEVHQYIDSFLATYKRSLTVAQVSLLK